MCSCLGCCVEGPYLLYFCIWQWDVTGASCVRCMQRCWAGQALVSDRDDEGDVVSDAPVELESKLIDDDEI